MSKVRGVLGMTAAIAMIAAVMSCSTDGGALRGGALPRVEPPAVAETKARDYRGLHNVVAYHEGYYSGSAPEGEEGFETLAGMGVKTIISVDGAAPDVATAKAQGMRYIHLPVGYNGFSEERKMELVRATRDSMREAPVYIHCHHGKHRSAGAAAAVAVCLGWADSGAMVERMKVSGTAPGYTGLYGCATSARVVEASLIDAVLPEFPEVSHPKGFVKAMVEIDEIMERLKLVEKAGWGVPGDHPDIVPVAEAGRMADLLRLQAEGDRAKGKGPEFARALRSNGEEVQVLEDLLGAGRMDVKVLSKQFQVVAASCKDCHVRYRD